MSEPMRGVYPILITPFDDQYRVDAESLSSLVDFLVANGVHGVGVALGSEVFKLNDEELELLAQIERQKVMNDEDVNRVAYQKSLQEHFENHKRDDAIVMALKDGYTQAQIAHFMRLSRSMVCKIIKRMREE